MWWTFLCSKNRWQKSSTFPPLSSTHSSANCSDSSNASFFALWSFRNVDWMSGGAQIVFCSSSSFVYTSNFVLSVSCRSFTSFRNIFHSVPCSKFSFARTTFSFNLKDPIANISLYDFNLWTNALNTDSSPPNNSSSCSRDILSISVNFNGTLGIGTSGAAVDSATIL